MVVAGLSGEAWRSHGPYVFVLGAYSRADTSYRRPAPRLCGHRGASRLIIRSRRVKQSPSLSSAPHSQMPHDAINAPLVMHFHRPVARMTDRRASSAT